MNPDHASTLRSAVATTAPALQALLQRLDAEDAQTWFLVQLARSPAGALAARIENTPHDDLDAATLWASLQACAALESAPDTTTQLGACVGRVTCTAALALDHSVLPTGTDPRQLEMDLLDIASRLDGPCGEFLAEAAVAISERFTPPRSTKPRNGLEHLHGGRIGRYRNVSPIGDGGMGVVYRAIQDGTQREVALKVLRPEIVSNEALSRFRQEALVLGKLHHEGIARIYETGICDSRGVPLPFFAMELVDGEPITEYATASQASEEARIRLVARVCDAIQYAHDHDTIHRDIKPANILVEASGRPKVLDFGIAQTERKREAVLPVTNPGTLVGTIAYMSPEQASGQRQEVDEQSDVYALGTILFELLTGRVPHLVEDKPIHEAVLLICDRDAPRLRMLLPTAAADLEAIVGKALARDKAERYASVRALANDLRRYVEGRPVEARNPTPLERVSKFVKRHRRAVATTAITVLVVTLAVGTTAVAWTGKTRAKAALRQIQRLQASLADSLSRLAEEVEGILPHKTAAALTREIAAILGSPGLGSTEGSRAAIRIERIVGDHALDIGDREAAWESRVRHLALCEALTQQTNAPEVRADLSIALVMVGDLYDHKGDTITSLEYWKRALAIDRELVHAHPEVRRFQDNLAWSWIRLGDRASHELDPLSALHEYRNAHAIIKSLAETHSGPATSFSLAWSDLRIATMRDRLGDTSPCVSSLIEHSRQIAEQLCAQHSRNRSYRLLLCAALRACARAAREAGSFEEAARCGRKAVRGAEALTRDNPASGICRFELRLTLHLLASIQDDAGDHDAAHRTHKRLLATVPSQPKGRPNDSDRDLTVLRTRLRLARDEGRAQTVAKLNRCIRAVAEVALTAGPQTPESIVEWAATLLQSIVPCGRTDFVRIADKLERLDRRHSMTDLRALELLRDAHQGAGQTARAREIRQRIENLRLQNDSLLSDC